MSTPPPPNSFGGPSAPATGPSRTRRGSKGALVGIVAVVVIVLIVLALLLTGVLPGLKSSSSSGGGGKSTYHVTFTETGLPSGTSWSVTLAGSTQSSTTGTIQFSKANGTYAFTVSATG